MSLTERAALVLREIDEQLSLAKLATGDKWVTSGDEPWNVWEHEGDENGSHCIAHCGPKRNYSRGMTSSLANAAFIAASRTVCPLALDCLKTAIKCLMEMEAHEPDDSRAKIVAYFTLSEIIEKWEAWK